MQLLKSLLFGVSLASIVVSALPFPDSLSEIEIAERDYDELLECDGLFPAHGSYSKNEAIQFVKSIPDDKLKGLSTEAGTIYSADNRGRPAGGGRPTTGHRLDMQGMAQGGEYHNIQVQMNGRTGKTTVGGLLVKGTWSPKRTKKELVHSIMHPGKDRHGNEYLRTQKVHNGKAPTHPPDKNDKIKIKTNAEARKPFKGGKARPPRRPKPSNPKSKKNRKAAKKEAWGTTKVKH